MDKSVSDSFIIIDLRSAAFAGQDLLPAMLPILERMPDDGILKLTAPKRLDAFIIFLQNQGYRVHVREWQARVWDIEVLGVKSPEIVDLRELEAPEPMEKVLMACSQLDVTDRYLARLPHVPAPLFPHLESRGLSWCVHEEVDQSALLLIWRAA